LAKLDSTVERELGSRFEIHGYPTLKFFINGTAQDYTGGRYAHEIVSWVKRRTEPGIKELTTQEEISLLLNSHDVVVLLIGAKIEENALEVLRQVARQYESPSFAYSSDSKLLKDYGIARTSIIMLKTFDETRKDCNCEISVNNVKSFVDTNQHPTITQINTKTTNRIFYELYPSLVLFLGEDQASLKAEESLNTILEKFKGRIILAKTKLTDQLGQRLANFVGVKPESLPAVSLLLF
jgi:protein disulfide-isomerase A1